EDKMQQNNNADTLQLNENNQSILKIMEKELSWSDRVITPKTKAYKDFVKEQENSSPEVWFRDGERIFTDQEKKFMQIYNYKNGIKEISVIPDKEIGISNIEPAIAQPKTSKRDVVEDKELFQSQSDKMILEEMIKDKFMISKFWKLIQNPEERDQFMKRNNLYDSYSNYLDLYQKSAEEYRFDNYTSAERIEIKMNVIEAEMKDLIINPSQKHFPELQQKRILEEELKKAKDSYERLSRYDSTDYINQEQLEYAKNRVDKLTEQLKNIIIGKISHYNLFGKILDVKSYNSPESYLKALEGQQDRINFKHETLLRDPKLLKAVDDVIYRTRGEKNPNSLEHYTEKEFNIPTIREQINLSEKQKEIFLKNGFINIPDESYGDELKVSLSMNKDGKISGMWNTGEEFNIRKEDLFPELVTQKENNQIHKLQEIPGSLALVSPKDLDQVSTETLIELKALKQYNVSDEMRADNFSTIKLLREDIDKIEKIISDRNINTNIQS
ncbi:hypothetical protein DBR28_17390, partial [Chryseobacterium sp. HMWF028]